MKQEESKDRRIFSRLPARFTLKYLDANSSQEGQGLAQDISVKGVGFDTSALLLPHTALEMWLEVPDTSQKIYTRGEVVWSRMVEPGRYRSGVNLERADFKDIVDLQL
ncbi:MAG: PilZ domain-containing protein [Candidatus Omnitrophota bacterium]